MRLLDLYHSRFGQAVRRQGNGWNGPCPLCGGEPGRSDRFMIWPDRTENLGPVCAENGISGIWSCRQCGASGDTIAYLIQAEGMSFRDALGELGISGSSHFRRRAPIEQIHTARSWEPKEFSAPSRPWQDHALRLLDEACREIWNQPQALLWLRARGICDEAILKYRLGYLEQENEKFHGRFRPRKAYGLEPKTGGDGRVRDKLFIPRGITIPTFSVKGDLINLRIRRHRSDLAAHGPKYHEHEGSCHSPLVLRSILPGQLAVYFITEAELDAMLIHFESGGVAGAVAVRTNRGKPDKACHELLKPAARICIALDYDSAGAEGCDFWEQTYTSAIRWPTPEGKDPGDAFAQGVDIRAWIEAGLPGSVRLPEPVSDYAEIAGIDDEMPAPESGQVEASDSGSETLGERGKLETAEPEERDADSDPLMAREGDFTTQEIQAIKAHLPAGTRLDDIYREVAKAWLIWRSIPVYFAIERDAAGKVAGFAWKWDYAWEERHREEFSRFWEFQAGAKDLREWLFMMPVARVDAGNLLHLWDLLDKEKSNGQ